MDYRGKMRDWRTGFSKRPEKTGFYFKGGLALCSATRLRDSLTNVSRDEYAKFTAKLSDSLAIICTDDHFKDILSIAERHGADHKWTNEHVSALVTEALPLLKDPIAPQAILIDLSNMSGSERSDFTFPLILRNATILGVLNVSGSRLGGIALTNCEMRGLVADSAQIRTECQFSMVAPVGFRAACLSFEQGFPEFGSDRFRAAWQGLDTAQMLKLVSELESWCQLRFRSCRIEAEFLCEYSILRSPGKNAWDRSPMLNPKDYLGKPDDDHHLDLTYALTFRGSTVTSRLQVLDGTVVIGGIDLYHAQVGNSLHITARYVEGAANRRDALTALNAVDARIGSGVFWMQSRLPHVENLEKSCEFGAICSLFDKPERHCKPAESSESSGGDGLTSYYRGRILFTRAEIDGDLHISKLQTWLGEGSSDASTRQGELVQTGGVDLRRAHIAGQLYIGWGSTIARNPRGPSGLDDRLCTVGPAIDAWKSTIELGVVLAKNTCFLGPVHFNGSQIGRELRLAANVHLPLGTAVELSPADVFWKKTGEAGAVKKWMHGLHIAIDLSDCELSGVLVVDTPHVEGRVSFERCQVRGAAEVTRLRLFQRYLMPELVDVDPEPKCRTTAGLERLVDDVAWEQRSLVDFQDMTIHGNVNFKRFAFEIERGARASIAGGDAEGKICEPTAGYVVDMRGMSCASFDDAEGTCWKGLQNERPAQPWLRKPASRFAGQSAVRWRIRLDGFQFSRVESSLQSEPIDHDMFRVPFHRRYMGLACRALTKLPFGTQWKERLAEWENTFFWYDRNSSSLRDEEVRRFRLTVLDSFIANRPRPMLTRIVSAWRWWWDVTLRSSWHQNATTPPFIPQPYQMFATAYLTRGEFDLSDEITIHRTRKLWTQRCRIFHRRVTKFVIFGSAIGLAIGTTLSTAIEIFRVLYRGGTPPTSVGYWLQPQTRLVSL